MLKNVDKKLKGNAQVYGVEVQEQRNVFSEIGKFGRICSTLAWPAMKLRNFVLVS